MDSTFIDLAKGRLFLIFLAKVALSEPDEQRAQREATKLGSARVCGPNDSLTNLAPEQ